MRTLSGRELNRTLLTRQLLLTRRRLRAAVAVERLLALQAQYAPSPYVALWSRVEGFTKAQLDSALARGSVVKATSLRTTLHVMARREYPFLAAAHIDSGRGRTENLGVDVGALWRAVPDEPSTSHELAAIAERVLGTDDRWTISFAFRALPFVRAAPVGPWPHTKPAPLLPWHEPLPDAAESAVRVVHRYLAAYGPASRAEIEHFTNFRVRQIAPALDGLRRFVDEAGEALFDLPRARIAPPGLPAPVRFLPAYDSSILAHHDGNRFVPAEYVDAVFNRRNTTTKNTFLVDGFVAGTWRVERKRLVVDPFGPLPAKVRRELDEEGARLLAFWLAAD
jgi:DNA glycosylase AlkZ-like